MQAKIETLKAKNANDEEYLVYPRTLIKCVTNENGDNLEDTLKDFVSIEINGDIQTIIDGTTIVGNADKLDGNDSTYFATSESVENIIDGTVTVAKATECDNALSLDGHGVEYFVDRGETLNTSVLEKALTLGGGMYNFVLGGGNYTGGDLLNTQYAYGTATVNKREGSGTTVLLWGGRYKLPLAYNQHNGTSWLGWDTLFTTAGGTINGNVRLEKNDASDIFLVLKNSLKHIQFRVYADGSFQIIDNTNSKELFTSSADGATNVLNGTASGNVVSNNGIASMNSLGGFAFKRTGGTVCIPKYIGNTSVVLGYLGFNGVDSPVVISSDGATNHPLLHTGNKPTGTYTGNGDATERSISLSGSVGNAVLIYSDYGYAIVTSNGAITIDSSGNVSFTKDAYYSVGSKVVIKTTNAVINGSGTRNYAVL